MRNNHKPFRTDEQVRKPFRKGQLLKMTEDTLIEWSEALRNRLERGTNGALDQVITNILEVERELTLREDL